MFLTLLHRYIHTQGSFTTQAIALAFIVALDMLMLLLAISLFGKPYYYYY
jgi:hypothetical protein